MAVIFKGDFAAIAQMAAGLSSLSSNAKLAISRRIAERSEALIAQGFAEEKAPDGSKWDPLKYRDGKPLDKTGDLKDSFTAKAIGTGVSIESSSPVFVHHQHGAPRANIPRRQMVPNDGELPPAWSEAFEEEAEEFIGEAMRRIGFK